MKILVRSRSFAGKMNAHIHQSWFEALQKVADVQISGRGFDKFHVGPLPAVIKHYYGPGRPDAIVFYTHDKGRTEEAREIEGTLKVMIGCDEVRHAYFIRRFHKEHKIDLVISKYLRPGLGQEVQLPVEYLPHSVDSKIFKDYNLKKEYDISFFGTFKPPRIYRDRDAICRMINNSQYKYILEKKYGGRKFIDSLTVAQVINKSKVGFAVPSGRDFLLSRYFEIPACRSMLLCSDTPGLANCFEKDKHYILFNGLSDFKDKLDYYLRNDDERQKITDAAHEHVMRNHTHEIRAKQFVKILEKYKKDLK